MTRRTRGVASLTVVAVIAGATPDARAWDDFGHMAVGAVAYGHLKPLVKKRALQLLQRNPHYKDWIVGASPAEVDETAFMRAATWADSIKSDATYKDDAQTAVTAGQNLGYADKLRHAYWHFVDQPFSPEHTPVVQPPAPNAATQIPILRAALAADGSSDDLKSYDLVWLLHLVGDVHQPLHCVSRFDAVDKTGDVGGNDVRISGNAQPPVCDDPRYCPFGPPSELHAFFDDIIGSGYGVAPAMAAARKLPKADAKKAAVLDPALWLQEGLALAEGPTVYGPIDPVSRPFAVDAEYQAAATDLGRQQIALAGQRLANLLNEAFAAKPAAK